MNALRLLSFPLFASFVLPIGQKSTINFNGAGMELGSSESLVRIMCVQARRLESCDDLAVDSGCVSGMNASVTLLDQVEHRG